MNSKNIANKVLMMVFVLFIVSIGLNYFYKNIFLLEMFNAVMEAALVGGVADWFAITAIFKKPLGIPWHTELIPRHRERVIEAIRGMVDQDLLTVESIKKRVDHTDFIPFLISFIENQKGKYLLRSWLENSCREIIKNLDLHDILGYLDGFVRNEIRKINTADQIKDFLRWLVETGQVPKLIIGIVDELIDQIEKTELKQNIYHHMEELAQANSRAPLERAFIWLGEQTNSVNISDAANVFYEEILTLLQEIKKPDHRLHTWMDEILRDFIDKPEMDFIWLDHIENWKKKLAADEELVDTAMQITDKLILTINSNFYGQLIEWLEQQIHKYWEFFKGNSEIQEWLEVRIKQFMYEFIEKEHYVIGEMVQRVLREFTDEKLNNFVEEKAGDDFQWIRINGSVVGGIVGLIWFLFLHYFYNDYVMSIIQGWL